VRKTENTGGGRIVVYLFILGTLLTSIVEAATTAPAQTDVQELVLKVQNMT